MLYSNDELYEYVLDNIQKVVFPEELIRLKLSLSVFELIALMMSEKYQTVTMSSLAQGMSVPMSTATGIVDRMVKKGLLERGRSEEDRRVVTISLSASGKELIDEFKGHIYSVLDRVRSLLTVEEFETALELLRKLVLGFQQEERATEKTVMERRIIEIE
ncbi:MarR family winged helix-turn-helix transcriptional regulator [Pelotomaculum propionicicum]|uniref:Transcriptional repressor MprA n=1 Tax=Pelotomaculum propionicicum TaxID=258475 RepID=A0A4Y7RLT8_9FIRM|nr:MarR family transcriptional regulator [Pelotomaculum propionicicum]NLI12931.1 MarR family transcriptional regulator [Peptococcaceae bacterium]TEB09833.1 Transcriptional repressor MprA [Pelotomaculum propionicicum]